LTAADGEQTIPEVPLEFLSLIGYLDRKYGAFVAS
jgi:hypothetical protein